MKRFWLIGPVFALALGGCGGDTTPQTTPVSATTESTAATAGLTVPNGFRVEVAAQGLRGPTQMIVGPNGRLWVAQLAGGEGDGSGQVVALSAGGQQQVLLRNLDKPTGIAVLGEALWIAAGRNLLRAPISGDTVGTPKTVLADLPFNGRSNGTLTVTPDQKLVFETSGSRTGNAASDGSATLWILDPAAPTAPQPLARGLKGAYAHTFDETGRLWSTEIADDLVDGAAPPDEINQIASGGDYMAGRRVLARKPRRATSAAPKRCARPRGQRLRCCRRTPRRRASP